MTTEHATRTSDGPTRQQDLIGRWLLAVAAIASVGAFAGGCVQIADAGDDRVWVEIWRSTAYLVFAGLFALMALAPRTHWGVWELVFVQKVALVVAGVIVGDVPEARQATFVDLGLVVILVVSYPLCRGWHAWRTRAAARVVVA